MILRHDLVDVNLHVSLQEKPTRQTKPTLPQLLQVGSIPPKQALAGPMPFLSFNQRQPAV